MAEPESKIIRLKYNGADRCSVVKFANGTPKSSSEFQAQFMKSKAGKEGERLMHLQSPHLSYIGNNFENKSVGQKFLLAEYDEETGVAGIFETDFYEVKPLLKSIFPSKEDTDAINKLQAAIASKKDERTFYEKQDDLTDVFGSHKRKRALAAKQRNKIADNSSVIQESVEAVLKGTDASALDEALSASNIIEATNMILPCNKTATDVSYVYPLNVLIPVTVSRSLIEISKHYINFTNADAEERNESSFVAEHAKEPPRSVVGHTQLHEEYVCCLQLMAYLIKAYKLRAADVRSSALFENEPAPFRKWFLSEFFLGAGRERKMPHRMKDKVMALAIVVAWYIDSFSSNSELLRTSFQVSQKKLSGVVRALGGVCKSVSHNSIRKEISVLALPLKFPTISTVGRRGRR